MPSPDSPLRGALPRPLVPAESASKAQWGYQYFSGSEWVMPTPPLFPQVTLCSGPGPEGVQREISANTESRSRSITDGTDMALIARSGSFSPCPVNTQTTVDPSGTPCLMSPATDADEAASQKTDWRWARNVYASRISSSVTAVMEPPDSDAAAVAEYQPAGLAM